MGITQYLKEIGRGHEGARSLSAAQAGDLMQQVLAGTVSDLELGAFVIAMRMKGESADELAGFVNAARVHCLPIAIERPTVVLPSYNGARKLPNLTPLLALMLAQAGVDVLVHGPALDAGRTTSAEVFQHLGLPGVRDAAEIGHAWARREPAHLRTELWCPPLQRLLDVRRRMGLRNSGHSVAKLLAPAGPQVLQVVNHTHPEFALLNAAFVAAARLNALLLRGTEGEPYADPRRQPRLEVAIGGRPRADLSRAAHVGVLAELPVLPRECDAASTARYIQAVVSGEKPAPPSMLAQLQTLRAALAALHPAGAAAAPALSA